MLATAIVTAVIATSSTGNNYAGAGASVYTGASYASSVVRTIESGTSSTSITIESNVNGQRTITEKTVPIPTPAPAAAPAPAAIEVGVAAHNGVVTSVVRIEPNPSDPLAVLNVGAAILEFIRSLLDPMAY